MTRLTQEQAITVHKGLIVLAVEVLMKKRKDYSGGEDPYSNLRVAENHGVHPVVGTNIRCNDKLVRVSRVVQDDSTGINGLVGENVIDGLRDGVNYMAIAAGLIAEEHSEVWQMLEEAATRWGSMGSGFDMPSVTLPPTTLPYIPPPVDPYREVDYSKYKHTTRQDSGTADNVSTP